MRLPKPPFWLVMSLGILVLLALSSYWIYTINQGLIAEEQERERQKYEKAQRYEERRGGFDDNYAIEVAERLNQYFSHDAIHPRQIKDLTVGALEDLGTGLDKGARDPYERVLIKGPLPSVHGEVKSWNRNPPLFIINDILVFIAMRKNCADSERQSYFAARWMLKNPDLTIIRIAKSLEVYTTVRDEEGFSRFLRTSVDNIRTMKIWEKTCKWDLR